MQNRIKSDLLLVGSLPFATTEESFKKGAELFSHLVFALPDGETGPRRTWVGYERETLCRINANLELVQETDSPTGIPRHAYETPVFKIRAGTYQLHWDSWPRIDDAIDSYQVFKRLKEEGIIPSHLRFQVGLPFPSSALNGLKANFVADYVIAGPAFEDLVIRELKRLTKAIPPTELAIQFDVCYEVLDIEGAITWMGMGAWERFAGAVSRLTAKVPSETLVGFHLCYGTFPEWPMYEARDMSLLVKMANFAVANAGRQVDWLHMAGPRYLRSEDERFFAPLAELQPGSARVFLGLVLHVDGAQGLRRRCKTAAKYLQDFGVALYCGFGRQPGEDGMETMREHRRIVESLRLPGVVAADTPNMAL